MHCVPTQVLFLRVLLPPNKFFFCGKLKTIRILNKFQNLLYLSCRPLNTPNNVIEKHVTRRRCTETIGVIIYIYYRFYVYRQPKLNHSDSLYRSRSSDLLLHRKHGNNIVYVGNSACDLSKRSSFFRYASRIGFRILIVYGNTAVG